MAKRKKIYMRGKSHAANHSFTLEKEIGVLVRDDEYEEWTVHFYDTPDDPGFIRRHTSGKGYAAFWDNRLVAPSPGKPTEEHVGVDFSKALAAVVGPLPYGYTWVATNDR